jgi:hypothetical protein
VGTGGDKTPVPCATQGQRLSREGFLRALPFYFRILQGGPSASRVPKAGRKAAAKLP